MSPLVAVAVLVVALLGAILATMHLYRQLKASRSECSELRRRMRRIATDALVLEHLNDADVKSMIARDTSITTEELASYLDRRAAA